MARRRHRPDPEVDHEDMDRPSGPTNLCDYVDPRALLALYYPAHLDTPALLEWLRAHHPAIVASRVQAEASANARAASRAAIVARVNARRAARGLRPV